MSIVFPNIPLLTKPNIYKFYENVNYFLEDYGLDNLYNDSKYEYWVLDKNSDSPTIKQITLDLLKIADTDDLNILYDNISTHFVNVIYYFDLKFYTDKIKIVNDEKLLNIGFLPFAFEYHKLNDDGKIPILVFQDPKNEKKRIYTESRRFILNKPTPTPTPTPLPKEDKIIVVQPEQKEDKIIIVQPDQKEDRVILIQTPSNGIGGTAILAFGVIVAAFLLFEKV